MGKTTWYRDTYLKGYLNVTGYKPIPNNKSPGKPFRTGLNETQKSQLIRVLYYSLWSTYVKLKVYNLKQLRITGLLLENHWKYLLRGSLFRRVQGFGQSFILIETAKFSPHAQLVINESVKSFIFLEIKKTPVLYLGLATGNRLKTNAIQMEPIRSLRNPDGIGFVVNQDFYYKIYRE